MTESEAPMLSSACCTGPGPYHLIGTFKVIRKIYHQINLPIKAGHSPSHNWLPLAAAAPTNQTILVRSFIYLVSERLKPRLSQPGSDFSGQHSANWAMGWTHNSYHRLELGGLDCQLDQGQDQDTDPVLVQSVLEFMIVCLNDFTG